MGNASQLLGLLHAGRAVDGDGIEPITSTAPGNSRNQAMAAARTMKGGVGPEERRVEVGPVDSRGSHGGILNPWRDPEPLQRGVTSPVFVGAQPVALER